MVMSRATRALAATQRPLRGHRAGNQTHLPASMPRRRLGTARIGSQPPKVEGRVAVPLEHPPLETPHVANGLRPPKAHLQRPPTKMQLLHHRRNSSQLRNQNLQFLQTSTSSNYLPTPTWDLSELSQTHKVNSSCRYLNCTQAPFPCSPDIWGLNSPAIPQVTKTLWHRQIWSNIGQTS